MPPSLIAVPYEVISYIVGYLGIRDVTSLARTCKEFQYIEREDKICRKILEEKLFYGDEVLATTRAGGGHATTYRRIAKRHESVSSAKPYSVAVVGCCDSYLYCQGVLCYTLDDRLRVLDLHNSHSNETVVLIPELLREFLPDADASISGRFRILYYNEGIISCLYTLSPALDSVAHLIVLDLCQGRIILNERLESTEKIFVRHNSEALYYGIFTGDINDRHKKWVLRGRQFQQKQWFQRVYLPELIGADVGVTVCFEIIGDYFYALSSQTTSEVEEIDWTSFYHCARFPVRSPCKESIEKTHEDKHMWRRQHREGPIDDRWAILSLNLDDASGDLNILETRREFKAGASTSQRTCYTTKVVFPEVCTKSPTAQHLFSTLPSSSLLGQSLSTATIGSTASSSTPIADFPEYLRTSSSTRKLEKHELVAATNDRLALTLTASDNPHWFPAQTRLPRNVHPSLDGPFVLAQTPVRYYNASAGSFIDLVDDRSPDSPGQQRLRLRISSRDLEPPLRDSYGLVLKEEIDPLTRETLLGYNESYKLREPALWPPEPSLVTHSPSLEALEEWNTLLNPPNHCGNVQGTADFRSMLYVTGGSQPNQPQAIVFINFDPSIQLKGLRRWGSTDSTLSILEHCEGAEVALIDTDIQGSGNPARHTTGSEGDEEKATIASECKKSQAQTSHCKLSKSDLAIYCNDGASWIWNESAMYQAINRGYDFGYVSPK